MKTVMMFSVGAVLIWAGVTGRLGLFLAAIFTPDEVVPNE